MFTNGQRVWSAMLQQWGIVEISGNAISFPIGVEFEDGSWECYTEDGKIYDYHTIPDLYPVKMKVVEDNGT